VAAERLAHELLREGVRDELEGMRAIRAAEWEAGAEARAAALAAEAVCHQAETEQLETLNAVKKEMIALYRAELEKKLQEDTARQRAEAEAEAEARSRRMEYNSERVEWRQAEFRWKVEKHQEEQHAREEEQEEKRARLDRLRALVAPQVSPGRYFGFFSYQHQAQSVSRTDVLQPT